MLPPPGRPLPASSAMSRTRSNTTLLAEREGRDYAEFEDSHGKVRIWHLGNRIGIFESSGGIKGDHSRFVVDYFRRHIEPHPRPWFAFGNWSHLLAYTPEVRISLTEWQIQQRYDELHVSHDSRMLAMGISVANAALPTTIQVHPTEEHLDDVLVALRRRIGV